MSGRSAQCPASASTAPSSAHCGVTRVGPADRSGTARAYTIDTLMRMIGQPEILLLKIDIEGSQKALFSENTDWIGHTSAIFLELDDWLLPWQGTSCPFIREMSKHDFEYLLNGENVACFDSHLMEVKCSGI
jgi:hypothetical protein